MIILLNNDKSYFKKLLAEEFQPEEFSNPFLFAKIIFCNISFVLRQVTVMHSMQAGYLEKAQKYTDKALMQLEKLKSKDEDYHLAYAASFHYLLLT